MTVDVLLFFSLFFPLHRFLLVFFFLFFPLLAGDFLFSLFNLFVLFLVRFLLSEFDIPFVLVLAHKWLYEHYTGKGDASIGRMWMSFTIRVVLVL